MKMQSGSRIGVGARQVGAESGAGATASGRVLTPASVFTSDPSSRTVPRGRYGLTGSPTVQWLATYSRHLFLADLVIASLAALTAQLVRFGPSVEGAGQPYVPVTLIFPLVWVAVFALSRCYESRFVAEGADEFRRAIDASIRFTGILALMAYGFKWDFARGYALAAVPLACVGGLAYRGYARGRLRSKRHHGEALHRTLVVGTERATAELMRRLNTAPSSPYKVVGALVDSHRDDVIEGVPVVGRSSDVYTVASELDVDTVAVATWSPFSQHDLRHLCWNLEGSPIDVVVTPNLTDVSGPRVQVRPVAGLPLLHVEKPEFHGYRRFAKGLFDRVSALVGLILLAPFILVAAIAVKLETRGPAFFMQERVGRGGRVFKIYKLRSMHPDAEARLAEVAEQNETDGLMFKMRHDPRITKVGHVLRRTSFDEIPQLLNVLRGEMSLVGPRPPLLTEVEAYEKDVHRRLLVKPGLTGLWQVSGRADLTWEDSVRLDLYYVENWSLYLDISILTRTIKAVWSAEGAY